MLTIAGKNKIKIKQVGKIMNSGIEKKEEKIK